MAYVPVYQQDLFVSYAHGDDREWIALFVARLEPALKRWLGLKPAIWLDEDALRASRNFATEIPESVRSSAAFLLLTSPTYIRSSYCVNEECRSFADTLPSRRRRSASDAFANELFAFRCPILPTDDNEPAKHLRRRSLSQQLRRTRSRMWPRGMQCRARHPRDERA